MPIKIIGKSILGELGFCQVPSKMGDHFEEQLKKVENAFDLPLHWKPFMTSMTGSEEVKLTNGAYFPKIRKVYAEGRSIFNPRSIYDYCKRGEDKFRPGCDFIIWDKAFPIVVTTFSREAPILAFESSTGKKCLGVILRQSLMKYGDYLFSTLNDALEGEITITLVTCNHFQYPEGSIPEVIQNFASKYNMNCIIGEDSEKNPECYHRGEEGNHVVAMW